MVTYIFGHKSPDTDTVCSSIALSYLKNALGGNTEAKVLGNINNETKYVLDYFKVSIPDYLNDVRVRIKDINFDREAFILESKSIAEAFSLMQKQNITAIPLVDEEKKLSGYVTLKELARYLINSKREAVDTTLENVVSTLDAKVLVSNSDKVAGKVVLVSGSDESFEKSITLSQEDIVIVGNRENILEKAIKAKVNLIIIPLDASISQKYIDMAHENGVSIIVSKFDSFHVATRIALSNYIKSININKSPVTVLIDSYYTDFKTMSHKVNHTNYPVIDNKGECLGLIRLTGPNEYEKQKVILVDHNNLAQSVDGIEEADILEIIDHHNLGAIGTSVPINFRSKPVGSTSTMIYDMYRECDVKIPKDMAGLMLSAILSDTLLLTSPTTTEVDRIAAKALAGIALLDADKYGLDMLKAASSIAGMSVEELIKSDFKTFVIEGKNLGIGQIMTLDFDSIKENIDEYVNKLDEMVNTNYNVVVIFVTDIIRKGSYVIYNSKAEELVKDSYGLQDVYQGVFIPGMVSRKKQMLPSIMEKLEQE